jgi:putative membrane protein
MRNFGIIQLSSIAAIFAMSVNAGAMGPASGASTIAGAPHSSLTAADKSFVRTAAVGGMAEVELGKLAQQKSSNDNVKQFGNHMVEDHTKANAELKQLAEGKGMTIPNSLDKSNRATMEKLSKLEGADFDRQYMKDMLADHKKDISEFKKASKVAKDEDIKGFAAKTLPTLQEHLQMAQSTYEQTKGK